MISSVRELHRWPCQNKQIGFYPIFYFETAIPTGSVRAPGHIYVPHVNKVNVTSGAHDQYADEQLSNLQKRICLVEFLRLGLVIGCQGGDVGGCHPLTLCYSATAKVQTDLLGRFFLCFLIVLQVRKLYIKDIHRFADL